MKGYKYKPPVSTRMGGGFIEDKVARLENSLLDLVKRANYADPITPKDLEEVLRKNKVIE